MKLRTATLLAIIRTVIVLLGNMFHLILNLALAGHVLVVYLTSFGSSALFHIGLLIFFGHALPQTIGSQGERHDQ
jgi:hypothetical protein